MNALRADWNVSGAELNGTERSMNGKFVNFKMFLTVVSKCEWMDGWMENDGCWTVSNEITRDGNGYHYY